MEVSVTELATNTDKYVDMAKEQDIPIIKNGTPTAKLVSNENPKLKALRVLNGMLARTLDAKALRLERTLRWEFYLIPILCQICCVTHTMHGLIFGSLCRPDCN